MKNNEDITSRSFLSQVGAVAKLKFLLLLNEIYLGEAKSFVIIFSVKQNNFFMP